MWLHEKFSKPWKRQLITEFAQGKLEGIQAQLQAKGQTSNKVGEQKPPSLRR